MGLIGTFLNGFGVRLILFLNFLGYRTRACRRSTSAQIGAWKLLVGREVDDLNNRKGEKGYGLSARLHL